MDQQRSPAPEVASIYTGQDLFEDGDLAEQPKDSPDQEIDPLERILRPVAKTFGDTDGRHKRQ